MQYTKPQLAVLGDAARVIQGSPKVNGGDSGSLTAEFSEIPETND